MSSISKLPSRKILIWTVIGTILVFAGGAALIWLVFDGSWADKAPIGDALNVLTAFFSALAFAVVAVSLWYQHREVSATIEEMRVTNEALMRPYVTIRLEIDWATRYSLVIENTGRTAAIDFRLSTDQAGPYPGTMKDRGLLSNAPAFQRPVETFNPGQRIEYLLTSGKDIKEEDPEFEKLPSSFSITADYGLAGSDTRFVERSVVDFTTFRHSIVPDMPEGHRLRDINEQFKRLHQSTRSIDRFLRQIANRQPPPTP